MSLEHLKLATKCTIFHIAKRLGLFKLAFKLTENEYRILCYHSGSIHDEHLFWPHVFITKDVFEKHLQLISKYNFNVLPLDTVIKNVTQHKIPKRTLVLTFDDGFYSTKKIIEPILKKANYKATLYLSTYYVVHQRPLFNVALAYLFFETKQIAFDIIFFNGEHHHFTTKDDKSKFSIETIIKYAETCDETQQNELLRNIGTQLQINMDVLFDQRIFHNLNPDELKSLHEGGIFDIQLHTHRHQWSNDENEINYEIQKNRKVIADITGKAASSLVNFSYPGGHYNQIQISILKNLGIESATKFEPRLNSLETNLFSLGRILCVNNKPLIVFEAEISGFYDLFINIFRTNAKSLPLPDSVNQTYI